jgi:hypothetical protein
MQHGVDILMARLTQSRCVRWSNGWLSVVLNIVLITMAVFADLEALPLDHILHIPGDANANEALCYILQNGRLNPDHTRPTISAKRILRAARALKLSAAHLSTLNDMLSFGIVGQQLGLKAYNNEWYHFTYGDSKKMMNVNKVLARQLKSAPPHNVKSPFALNGHWFFPHADEAPNRRLGWGCKVLKVDPVAAVTKAAPKKVVQLLRKFPGRIALAGGFVNSAMVRGVGPAGDCDLFITTQNVEHANLVLNAAYRSFGTDPACVTDNAVTWMVDGVKVQIILTLYCSADNVINSFDFAPCAVYITASPSRHRRPRRVPVAFIGRATSAWTASARYRAFPLHLEKFSPSTLYRMCKYFIRGEETHPAVLCMLCTRCHP